MYVEDRSCRTPLYEAVHGNHHRVVVLLLSGTWITHNDYTALHLAASLGYGELVRQLLELNPGMIELTGNEQQTALHSVAIAGHSHVMAQLLAFRPSLASAVDMRGQTALHLAVNCDHLHVAKQLLAVMPSPNAKDYLGNTPLHYARSGPVAEELLSLEPLLLTSANFAGHTPLHAAAARGGVDVMTRLLAHADQALIDAVDGEMNTALHHATMLRNQVTVELLLAHSPQMVRALNKHGHTALHLAVAGRGDFALIELLWRLYPEASLVGQNSPLMLAVRSGQFEVVELMQRNVSFGEVVDAFVACQKPWEPRLRPAVEGQCECLLQWLPLDVVATVVMGYLGLEGFRGRKRPRNEEET